MSGEGKVMQTLPFPSERERNVGWFLDRLWGLVMVEADSTSGPPTAVVDGRLNQRMIKAVMDRTC